MIIGQDTETVNNCILCHDSDIAPDDRFRYHLGLVEPYGVMRCTRCNLRWLSPRPTQQAYQTLYSYNNYFEGDNVVESYSQLARQRLHYFEHRIKKIENRMPHKRKLSVLDVGSATGEFVHLCEMKGHLAVGQEFSADARRVAKSRYNLEL